MINFTQTCEIENFARWDSDRFTITFTVRTINGNGKIIDCEPRYIAYDQHDTGRRINNNSFKTFNEAVSLCESLT